MYPAGLTCRAGGRPDGGKDPTCPLWRGIATHTTVLMSPFHACVGVAVYMYVSCVSFWFGMDDCLVAVLSWTTKSIQQMSK